MERVDPSDDHRCRKSVLDSLLALQAATANSSISSPIMLSPAASMSVCVDVDDMGIASTASLALKVCRATGYRQKITASR